MKCVDLRTCHTYVVRHICHYEITGAGLDQRWFQWITEKRPINYSCGSKNLKKFSILTTCPKLLQSLQTITDIKSAAFHEPSARLYFIAFFFKFSTFDFPNVLSHDMIFDLENRYPFDYKAKWNSLLQYLCNFKLKFLENSRSNTLMSF